jgi:SAM-dependent methyltransferase
MSTAKSYWDQKYTSDLANTRGQPQPNTFLKNMLPRLHKGKVLDIGSGLGANALFLAQNGFQVTAVDVSAAAIKYLQQQSLAAHVSIDSKEADMDFFMMGLMVYDSVVMTFFKPPLPRYYNEITRALKQGGTLLVESYSTAEQPEPLGPEDAYKNFYFNSNELLKNFSGLKILFYQEAMLDNKHVVQMLAQKPLDKDAAKYNLFDMSSTAIEKPKDRHRELAESLFKKPDNKN